MKVPARQIVAVIVSATVAGCAASSGILPVGPNTYTVTERFSVIRGGSLVAEQTALSEANDFCAQRGQQFVAIDMMMLASISNASNTNTGYSVTFRCALAANPQSSLSLDSRKTR